MKLQRLDEHRWRIPREGPMRVPGTVFATEAMVREISHDGSGAQVANVATLPGIVEASLAMPDIHSGYGFPIGGVAAFREDGGVVSPGGVGYDINCGVRLLRTSVAAADVTNRLEELSLALQRAIPSGVGSKSHHRLSDDELEQVLLRGSRAVVERGFGTEADLDHTEDGGVLPGAEPASVSPRAKQRGLPQLGSLGSGNHFCELGRVAEIYDPPAARAFGLEQGALTLMIHSGSRGLGYQVCDDSLRDMLRASTRYGIALPDRQLCAAPLGSPEAARYLGAMAAAANFAFANRQMLAYFAVQAIERTLGSAARALGLRLVYDVCHNIAKLETHETVDGRLRLCVHRKGATRALGPGRVELPHDYRSVGQPVLVPGDMGRYSFVMVGSELAERRSFSSTCHGAGRRLSRGEAKRSSRGRPLVRELRDRGIWVRSDCKEGLLEEIPEAYKDVADVVEVAHGAGLARKVAKLEPLVVVKG